MSWEDEETSQTVCPCGNGRITQKHYSDDWAGLKTGLLLSNVKTAIKNIR